MFILNRYLLRQFLQIFFICFISLIGLYVVIDAFQHLDRFSTFAEKEGPLLGVIGRYYTYHSLAFFDRTSGILAMISAIFTVAWLGRHQELTAFMAAGISKFRVIKPVLVATAAISIVAVLNRELVIPSIREELTRDTKDLGGTAARSLDPRLDSQTDILIAGDKVILAERRIISPAFVLLNPDLSVYGKQLAAREATHLNATPDHPAGFVLSGVTAPPAEHICTQPSLLLDGQPVIVTPHDVPWLGPDEVFVVSQAPFELLAAGATWQSYASLPELLSELRNPRTDVGADVRVNVHAHLMQPFMDATLVMLGVPLMLSRRRRNVFLSIGICLTTAAAFTLIALFCRSLGNLSLLRPAMAVWLPMLIFVPIAAGMANSLRT